MSIPIEMAEQMSAEMRLLKFTNEQLYKELEIVKIALGKKTSRLGLEDPFLNRVNELEDLNRLNKKEIKSLKLEIASLNRVIQEKKLIAIESEQQKKIAYFENVIKDLVDKRDKLLISIESLEKEIK